jgi:hypothetical protein
LTSTAGFEAFACSRLGLRHGVTTSRMEGLSQAVGVDRRIVERWRVW